MKTYTVDGLTGSAADVVADLHKASRAPAVNDRTWMQQTADRAHLMNGSVIRADTAEHFLDDLVEANLLNTVMEK